MKNVGKCWKIKSLHISYKAILSYFKKRGMIFLFKKFILIPEHDEYRTENAAILGF